MNEEDKESAIVLNCGGKQIKSFVCGEKKRSEAHV